MPKALLALPLLLVACRSVANEIDTSRPSRSFRFVYRASVEGVPDDAKETRLWVPVPIDNADQEIDAIELRLDIGARSGGSSLHLELDDGFHGHAQGDGSDRVKITLQDIENGTGRALCVETGNRSIDLELSFDVKRYESRGGGMASERQLREALGADALVPLDGKVGALAATLELSSDPMVAARQLYEHTLERMHYEKPENGGWGRGDAEWACDSRHGNCTDFHSYFMGLARARGIPARFEMGFSIVGGDDYVATVPGYHCWALFWIDGRGWIPVDISEADKHPEKADSFFGSLDADRFTVTGGRDLILVPEPAQGPVNYFVYPVAEVDGEPWAQVSRAFERIRR